MVSDLYFGPRVHSHVVNFAQNEVGLGSGTAGPGSGRAGLKDEVRDFWLIPVPLWQSHSPPIIGEK